MKLLPRTTRAGDCRCGCGERIPAGSRRDRRYINNAHAKRARYVRKPPVTSEARRRWGREGGRTRAMGYPLRLLAQVAHLDRAAAIWKAYVLGQRAAYRQKARLAA